MCQLPVTTGGSGSYGCVRVEEQSNISEVASSLPRQTANESAKDGLLGLLGCERYFGYGETASGLNEFFAEPAHSILD